MAKSMHDRFVAALKARGSEEIPNARTGKYTVMTRPGPGTTSDKKPLFYYVGTHGALRVGGNATRSIPVSDDFKEQLLAESK